MFPFAVQAARLRGTLFHGVSALTTSGTNGLSMAFCFRVPETVAIEAPHGVRDVRSHRQIEVFDGQSCRGFGSIEGQDPGIGPDLLIPPADDDSSRMGNPLHFCHDFLLRATV